MFGTIVSRTRRRLSLMLVVGLLTALLGAVSADAAAAQPASCSVSNADGGIDVSWQALDGAAEYVYRLEVPGENNRYRRVDATSTFIELAEGDVGTVFVSAVFSNGSYSASVGCGSGQANDGTGGQPSTCSVANANGGIDATWSYVNGAVEYVYRLEVDGQDNRYRRVMGTSAFIPLNEGVVGTVFVSGVRADGSYTPAVACGSGQANEGTGGQNASCTSESADGGIRISWTAVPDAAVYVYRLEVDGQNNRYGVFPAEGDLSGVVQAPAGTVGTLFISARFANGTYSAGVPCGTATAGGGGGGIDAPAECWGNSAPSGVDLSWSPVADAASYIVYRSQFNTDELKEIPTSETSIFEELDLRTSGENFFVAAVAADGSISDRTSCGYIEPGTPLGPECTVVNQGSTALVSWGDLSYGTSLHFIDYTAGGVDGSQTVQNDQSYEIQLSGGPVTAATVSALITIGGPGGPTGINTLASECTISGNGGIAAPASCTSTPEDVPADESGATISWDSVDGAAGYVLFVPKDRQEGFFEFPAGADATSKFLGIAIFNPKRVTIAAVDGNGNVSERADCGVASAGQPPGPATCTATRNGSTTVVNWDQIPRARVYFITWVDNGETTTRAAQTQFEIPSGTATDITVFAQVSDGGPRSGAVESSTTTCSIGA